MKLLIREPKKVVRIAISRHPQKTHYIPLDDTNLEKVYKFVVEKINELPLPNVITGRRTSIVIRESLKGINGKSISLVCYGIIPKNLGHHLEQEIGKLNLKSEPFRGTLSDPMLK